MSWCPNVTTLDESSASPGLERLVSSESPQERAQRRSNDDDDRINRVASLTFATGGSPSLFRATSQFLTAFHANSPSPAQSNEAALGTPGTDNFEAVFDTLTLKRAFALGGFFTVSAVWCERGAYCIQCTTTYLRTYLLQTRKTRTCDSAWGESGWDDTMDSRGRGCSTKIDPPPTGARDHGAFGAQIKHNTSCAVESTTGEALWIVLSPTSLAVPRTNIRIFGFSRTTRDHRVCRDCLLQRAGLRISFLKYSSQEPDSAEEWAQEVLTSE